MQHRPKASRHLADSYLDSPRNTSACHSLVADLHKKLWQKFSAFMLAKSPELATNHCCLPVLSRRYQCKIISSVRALHVVGHAAVQCPPADFDPRQTIRIKSDRIVRERYPQLCDLAEKGEAPHVKIGDSACMAITFSDIRGWLPAHAGVLTAVQRPVDYVERRDDGYQVSPRLIPEAKALDLSIPANEALRLGYDEISEACSVARGSSV